MFSGFPASALGLLERTDWIPPLRRTAPAFVPTGGHQSRQFGGGPKGSRKLQLRQTISLGW